MDIMPSSYAFSDRTAPRKIASVDYKDGSPMINIYNWRYFTLEHANNGSLLLRDNAGAIDELDVMRSAVRTKAEARRFKLAEELYTAEHALSQERYHLKGDGWQIAWFVFVKRRSIAEDTEAHMEERIQFRARAQSSALQLSGVWFPSASVKEAKVGYGLVSILK